MGSSLITSICARQSSSGAIAALDANGFVPAGAAPSFAALPK
jgi:hypothetical protein